MAISSEYELDTHPYASPKSDHKRAPCPGLNTLANHGYISRDGKFISFTEVITAIRHVYHLSFALAFLLSIVGYLTCGTLSISFPSRPNRTKNGPNLGLSFILSSFFFYPFNALTLSWTLNLDKLSEKGLFGIAHNAALVHRSTPTSCSNKPDAEMLKALISLRAPASTTLSTSQDSQLEFQAGLSLRDLAAHRVSLERAQPLSTFHQEVSQGELALGWLLLCARRGFSSDSRLSLADDDRWINDALIPIRSIEQWFGEERLPDGWWSPSAVTRRPHKEVGLLEARRWAEEVKREMNDLRASRTQ